MLLAKAQADFGEALVVVGGVEQKAHYLEGADVATATWRQKYLFLLRFFEFLHRHKEIPLYASKDWPPIGCDVVLSTTAELHVHAETFQALLLTLYATYIALFSHFIPCGVWEAVYILDGLLKNESEIQPDVLHADTQGQSEPVFALAHLLGIKLMPRIRNWKNIDLCQPDRKDRFEHIESLFSGTIDWTLIETHFPDMLRVVLSIKAGRISASTILRRLGTYSRKNRLYQAFCELGRVIRTGFLLRYISSQELRSLIQGATNKSEALNRFLQWAFFGGEGIISENSRDEQRKAIKYNHLVANCLIFHNLCSLTRLVQNLEQRGESVPEDAIAAISPYLTEHINRFGDYTLNLDRKPPQPDYGYTLKRSHAFG